MGVSAHQFYSAGTILVRFFKLYNQTEAPTGRVCIFMYIKLKKHNDFSELGVDFW